MENGSSIRSQLSLLTHVIADLNTAVREINSDIMEIKEEVSELKMYDSNIKGMFKGAVYVVTVAGALAALWFDAYPFK